MDSLPHSVVSKLIRELKDIQQNTIDGVKVRRSCITFVLFLFASVFIFRSDGWTVILTFRLCDPHARDFVQCRFI